MAIFQELLKSLSSGQQIIGEALPDLSYTGQLPASAELANRTKAETAAGTQQVFKQLLDSLGTVQMNPEAPFSGNPAAPGYQAPPVPIEQLDPGSVMSLPPQVEELLMSVASPQTAAPLVEEQLAVQPPVPATGKKAASGAGGSKAKGGSSTGKGDSELEALLKAAGATTDRSGERGTLDSQRNALLAKAEAEHELSNEEKVAVALLGALPGLVGAIGGGAIAGGYGAAAGAAGGLQGGAAGIQGISEAKAGRRKEAKTEAQVLAERIAKLDDMMAIEKTRAADKQLEIRLGERAAARSAAEHQKNRVHEWAKANLSAATQMQIARLGADTDLQKARLSASAGGGKVTEFEGQSAYHADAMLGAMPALERGEKTRGSIAGALMTKGIGRFFADPVMQQYAVAAKQFINAINRRESGAALTEREVEEAYDRFLPLASDSPQTIEYKRQQREAAFSRMAAAAGHAAERINIPQEYQAAQGNLDSQMIEWAKANPAAPYAKEILQAHGLLK